MCISTSHWQIFILSPSLPVQSRDVPDSIPMLFELPQELLVTSFEIPCWLQNLQRWELCSVAHFPLSVPSSVAPLVGTEDVANFLVSTLMGRAACG